MYFVINCFVAAVCFVALLLFTEMFPKWIKVIIGLIQSTTLAYAIAILVKKIGEWTGVWSGDSEYIFTNFLWILPIVIVVSLLIVFILNKRKKA